MRVIHPTMTGASPKRKAGSEQELKKIKNTNSLLSPAPQKMTTSVHSRKGTTRLHGTRSSFIPPRISLSRSFHDMPKRMHTAEQEEDAPTPDSHTYTRDGYLINDFCVEDDEEGRSEEEDAVQLVRELTRRAHSRRRAYAVEYERIAKRQRCERVERDLPAEEEENDSSSIGSTDTDEEDSEE